MRTSHSRPPEGLGPEPPARHPLDPLTAEEIRAAVRGLRAAGKLSDRARFVSVDLREPPKASLLAAEGDGRRPSPPNAEPSAPPPDRAAFVVVNEPGARATYEGVVTVADGRVHSWRKVPGARGPVTPEEYAGCERVVRADRDFRRGLERRGIHHPERVLVEAWGIGSFAAPQDAGRRLVWTLAFYRARPSDNPYAKPVHGLHAIVDLDELSVVRVEDLGVVPLPPGDGAYAAGTVPPRTDLRPLEIREPDGPSFELDGWQLRWQRWQVRLGFTAREGLVLHAVGYADAGRLRPVLHRASLAELVIPYADPRPFQGYRNAFDIGEYGIGRLTNSLERGCDCLGEIRYLDAELADGAGEPYLIRNAICVHEEDAGLLWKHVDDALGTVETRRSRRLVISFIITAGNYEYAFYWHLYQDGAIELEVKLTGIVLTSALAPGEVSEFGTVVAPGTLAAHHQHFFCVRLEPAVDGPHNTVFEVDTEPVPAGPENPYGNAFRPVRRALCREQEAQRTADPRRARYWLIANPNRRNGFGEHPGYRLVPGTGVLPCCPPEAAVARRAAFATKHLWVTPVAEGERFPAGDYPNLHPGGAGLPAWTAANRPIENTDLVVWYTLGSHHIPRPEDWPVMPVERVGFGLKPDGFFDRNPALDVPPSAPARGAGPG